MSNPLGCDWFELPCSEPNCGMSLSISPQHPLIELIATMDWSWDGEKAFCNEHRERADASSS